MTAEPTPGTDVELADQSRNFDVNRLDRLSAGHLAMYSSLVGDDQATKLKVYDAMTNALRVDEHLNETINLANIIIRPQDITDPKTGEVSTSPSVTLIDADGTAYTALSVGLFQAMENFIGLCGHPTTWEGPIPIKVVQERTRAGFRVFTVRLAGSQEKSAK